jgi:hypothetical protein
MSNRFSLRRMLFSKAALAGWLACCALGWYAYARFAYSPGELALAPQRWPSSTCVERTDGRSQIIVFVHPRCGCTWATLTSLGEVVQRATATIDVHVLFFRPRDAGDDWARTNLWHMAEAIPGADVRADVDGVEARRFGAKTSGQVLFYDADGALQLTTGLTPGRGHTGDNDGLASLAKLVHGQPAATHAGPVFGCPLGNNRPSEQQIVSRMGSDR